MPGELANPVQLAELSSWIQACAQVYSQVWASAFAHVRDGELANKEAKSAMCTFLDSAKEKIG